MKFSPFRTPACAESSSFETPPEAAPQDVELKCLTTLILRSLQSKRIEG